MPAEPFTDSSPPQEPLNREQLRNAAFQSAAFYWKDQPLQPLAISREADWLLHCHQIGLPPLSGDLSSHSATFFPYAIRLVWFCAHEPKEWLGAGRASFGLDKVIRNWADAHVLPGDQPAFIKLAWDIYDRAYLNKAVPQPDGTAPPGNSPGPSAKLNS